MFTRDNTIKDVYVFNIVFESLHNYNFEVQKTLLAKRQTELKQLKS